MPGTVFPTGSGLKNHAFTRYLFSGGFCNAVAFLLFGVLYHRLPALGAVTVFLLAALLTMPLSFVLNRLWVFASGGRLLPQICRFVVVYVSAMALGATSLGILLKVLSAPVILTQAVSTVLVALITFVTHSLWTFAHRSPRDSRGHDR